MMKATGCSSS